MQADGRLAEVGCASLGAEASWLQVEGQPVEVNSFSRDQRRLNSSEFKQVFDSVDIRASHKHLLLLARFNRQSQHRLGIVIAKKHVRQAVQRNRIKRIIREFFRCCSPTEKNLDVIVLARPGADRLDNAALSSILRHQWRKLTVA